MEAKQALHKVRHKLRSLKTLRQVGPEEKLKLDAFDAFAGALPLQFLLLFKKWLCTGTDRNAVNVSLDDLVGWLRCELIMRIFNGSSQDLEWWGAAETDRNRYKRVRLAMTKADRPVSKREVLDGTARAMPGTFDPINIELEQACCKEWIDMFFVNGSSWVDIDDDKLNHSSKNFPKYGYRVTPTKDKKLKPVIHVMATVGSGFIVFFYADTLFRTLISMLTTVIEALKAANIHLQQLLLFIDRTTSDDIECRGGNIFAQKPKVHPAEALLTPGVPFNRHAHKGSFTTRRASKRLHRMLQVLCKRATAYKSKSTRDFLAMRRLQNFFVQILLGAFPYCQKFSSSCLPRLRTCRSGCCSCDSSRH